MGKTVFEFSLLKDWYFCNCVNLSPIATEVYLTSLYNLQNREAESDLKKFSFQQIENLDNLYLSLYALPHVLMIFKNDFPTGFELREHDRQQIVKFYCTLAEEIGEDRVMKDNLSELLRVCFGEQNSDKLPALLQTISKQILEDIAPDVYQIPYQNMRLYPEASILATCIRYLAIIDPQRVNSLSASNANESSNPVKLFVERCLQNQFGRFCFGRCLKIAYPFCTSTPYEPDYIWSNLLDGVSGLKQFEPDILLWYAEAVYLPAGDGYESLESDEHNFLKLFDEYEDFLHLQNLITDSWRLDEKEVLTADELLIQQRIEDFFKRTGIVSDQQQLKKTRAALPVIFWQSALVEIGMSYYPTYAIQKFQKYLKSDEINAGEGAPLKQGANLGQSHIHMSLLGVKHSKLFKKGKSYENPVVDQDCRWLIQSPRLSLHNINSFTGERRLQALTEIFTDPLYSISAIRLTAFSISAVRMLQQVSEDERKEHAVLFLELLIELKAYIFSRYDDFVKQHLNEEIYKQERPAYVSVELVGFYKVAGDILNFIGSGKSDTIPPKLLMLVFERPASGFVFGELVPAIFFIWLDGSFLGISDPDADTGASRWLPFFDKIWDEFHASVYKEADKILILVTLLCDAVKSNFPGKYEVRQYPIPKKFDWRTDDLTANYDTNGPATPQLGYAFNPTKVIHPRNLLITKNTVFNDWKKLLIGQEEKVTIHIIRSAKALLDLEIREYGVEIEAVSDFLLKLENDLSRVSEVRELDRYLRMTFLQLWDKLAEIKSIDVSGANLNSHNTNGKRIDRIRGALILLFLEYGSTLEIRLLLAKIFSNSTQEYSERKILQSIATRAMLAKISLANAERTIKRAKLLANRAEADRAIKEMLKLLSFWPWQANASLNDDVNELAQSYRSIAESKIGLQSKIDELSDDAGREVARSNQPFNTISLITNDASNHVVRLFRKTLKQETSELPNEAQKQLHYVIQTNDNGEIYLHNGFGKLTRDTISPTTIDSYEVGEVYERDERDYKKAVYSNPDLQAFSSSNWNKEFEVPPFLKKLIDSNNTDHDVLKEWLPNVSALFSSVTDTHQVSAILTAVTDESVPGGVVKIWKPLRYQLAYLLVYPVPAHYCIEAGGQRALMLTFIGEEHDEEGKKAWLFSLVAGINFLIYEDEFTPESRSVLANEISRIDAANQDKAGLLVTVVPVVNTGLAQLKLAGEGRTHCVLYNDEIKLPFDYRNLNWFSLGKFQAEGEEQEENENVIVYNPVMRANREGGSWKLVCKDLFNQLPAQFPKHIKVKGINDNSGTVNCIVGDWNPYLCIVEGKKIEERVLAKVNGSYDYLRYPPRQDENRILTIKEYTSGVVKGIVRAITYEGLEVSVYAESLTMQPIQLGDKKIPRADQFGRDRKLRIEKTPNFSNKPLLIVDAAIPANLGADRKGIVIKKQLTTGILEIQLFPESIFPSPVQIKVIPKNIENVHIGDFVEVSKSPTNNSTGTYKVSSKITYCHALWQKRQESQMKGPLHGSIYLGQIMREGKSVAIFETPGKPGFFIESNDESLNYFSRYSNKGAIISYSGQWKFERTYKGERLMLFGKGEFITGILPDDQKGILKGSLVDINIDVTPIGDEDFKITRSFFIQEEQIVSNNPVMQSETNLVALWKNLFEQKRNEEKSFFYGTVVMNKDGVSYRLKLEGNYRIPVTADKSKWDDVSHWTDTVDIITDGGVYISFRSKEYPKEKARFILVPPETDDKPYLASFMQVTTADYKALRTSPNRLWHNANARGLGTDFKNPLYFEGKRRLDDVNGRREVYIFEAGFGRFIYIPVDKVFIRNRDAITPFSDIENIFFHGDEIRQAVVSANDEFIIEAYSIESNERRKFYSYHQSSNHPIVCYLDYNPQTKNIVRVRGLGPDMDSYKMNSYNNLFASLSKEDAAIIESKIALWKENSTTKLYSFAAVFLSDQYRPSRGRRMYFKPIKLTFDKPQNETYRILDENALIFVEAVGKVEKGNNDYLLNVKPFENPNDMGADVAKMRILRRNFSVDEDTLRRISDNDPTFFDGKIFLVQIQKDGEGTLIPQLFAPVGEFIFPYRPIAVLDSMSVFSETSITYIRKTRKAGKDLHIFEYKPGIFIAAESLKTYHYNRIPDKGDVLKYLRKAQTLIVASLSDRYYTYENRPIVVLPRNRFMNDKNVKERYSGKKHEELVRVSDIFSAGSLPNLELKLRDGTTYGELYALMGQKHPKIGYISLQGGQAQLSAKTNNENDATLNTIMGFLADDWSHTFTDLHRTQHPINILQTSFCDDVLDIIRANQKRFWRYPDERTPRWVVKSNGEIKVERDWIKPEQTGPVVFHNYGNGFTLRYKPENIRQLGFPARELVDLLGRNEKEGYAFTVASVNHDKVPSIWFELAPGRLSEVPLEMLAIEVDGKEYLNSETRLDLSLLASGDVFVLKLKAGSVQTASTILIQEIKPGIRGRLGRGKYISRVNFSKSADMRYIGVRLGRYPFIFTVPPIKDISDKGMVELDLLTNQVVKVEKVKLGADSIMQVYESEGRLKIEGLPDLQVKLHTGKDLWQNDLLTNEECENEETLNAAFKAIIKNLLSLPVTAETIDGKSIIISRRLQQRSSPQVINPGQFFISSYITASGNNALMFVGKHIKTIPVTDLISGLDSLYAQPVLEMLKKHKQIQFYLRNDNGNIVAGLPSSSASKIKYAVVVFVVAKSKSEAGIVCRETRTGKVYFLSGKECVIGKATPEIMNAAFPPGTLVEFESGKINTIVRSEKVSRWINKSQSKDGFDAKVIMVVPLQDINRPYTVYIKPLDLDVLMDCTFFPSGKNILPEILSDVTILSKEIKNGYPALKLVAGETPYRLDIPLNKHLQNAEIKFEGTEPVQEWLNKIKEKEVLPLNGALQALLTMLEHNAIEEVLPYFEHLYLRALRSVHVEVLMRCFVPYETEEHPLLARFKVITHNLFSEQLSVRTNALKLEQVIAFRNFKTAADLRSESEFKMKQVADALMATIGELKSDHYLTGGDNKLLLNRIVKLYNALPTVNVLRKMTDADKKQIGISLTAEISSISSGAKVQCLNIPLLKPLITMQDGKD